MASLVEKDKGALGALAWQKTSELETIQNSEGIF